jgi:L-threonylcarbamoyladenylate synthase
VLDPLHTPPLLLRPGGITREQIEAVIGPLEVYVPPADQPPKALASPGLAGRHYAPEARVEVVEGERDALLAAARARVEKESQSGNYVGVLAPEGWLDESFLGGGGLVIFDWGKWGDWTQLAHNLFSGLRYLDKPGVSVILAPLPPAESLGLALRDRLLKAAK